MTDRRLLTLSVAVMTALVVISATGCAKRAATKTPDLGSRPGSSGGASEGSASVDTSADARSTVGGGSKSSTGSSGSGSSTSGKSGSSTSGQSNTGAGAGSGSASATGTMKVRVLWWNDTEKKQADGFTVILGSTKVVADVSQKSGSGMLGPVAIGPVMNLAVYPDGMGGKKIVVPVTMNANMVGGSEQDAIHVEVSDTKVRVLGNPVEGFDVSFDRF